MDPNTPTFGGSLTFIYHTAREEAFIDENGNRREAIGYGTQVKHIVCWYDYEEFLRAFPKFTEQDKYEFVFVNSSNFEGLFEK